jgi:hypothetical protein
LKKIKDKMEKKSIIEELYFCAAQCTHCYDACQIEKDKDELQKCMMNDLDCSDICRLTGQLLERHSENAELFLKLCVEMCERCATECEKHPHMEHCKKCAIACRECAEMCSKQESVH